MLEIVRSSKGRPSNLSDRERKELRALLGKVEPGELAKKVATSPFAGRVRRRCRINGCARSLRRHLARRPPLSGRPLDGLLRGVA